MSKNLLLHKIGFTSLGAINSLTTEFKDNEVFFELKPLLAAVKGLTAPADLKEESLDSYELEVIDGNHRRAAMKAIQNRNPDCPHYKYAQVILS